MTDMEKALNGLECCSHGLKDCDICPYHDMYRDCITKGLAVDAMKLLKNEPNAPAENTTYQRLMAIKVELEDKNKALTTEARELRRLNESLSNLCHNLLKRLAKYE